MNSLPGVPFHHQTPLLVKPGETTEVVIQERPGTRITGRFLAPPNRTLSWRKSFVVAHFIADLPPTAEWTDAGSPAERARREMEFWTSPAGRARVNTPPSHAALLQDDGSFLSLDLLSPGSYSFQAVFTDGSATRHLVVNGEPEQALGEIPLR